MSELMGFAPVWSFTSGDSEDGVDMVLTRGDAITKQ